MERFEQLVKALRCKRDDCEGCGLAFFDKDEGWMCQYAAKDDDAAAAIEDLEGFLAEAERDRDEYEERMRKEQERVIELQAEVRKAAKRNSELHAELEKWVSAAEKAGEPKRGEWVRVEDEESYHYECSRCGERPLYSRYGDVVLSGVCPMCGAKMTEVQDGQKES